MREEGGVIVGETPRECVLSPEYKPLHRVRVATVAWTRTPPTIVLATPLAASLPTPLRRPDCSFRQTVSVLARTPDRAFTARAEECEHRRIVGAV